MDKKQKIQMKAQVERLKILTKEKNGKKNRKYR